MESKVSNLSVKQLKNIIIDIIDEKIENLVEDYEALSSEKFLKSIAKARHEYKEGKFKTFEEVFGEIQNTHHRKRSKRLKPARQ